MKFSLEGRMANMRLPDGKSAILYCVWEAVSNALHAIEDRFGKEHLSSNGKINIRILTDEDGAVNEISVRDNGVGFNSKNLDSFDTCDSIEKSERGGKGVGRLVWFKTFKKIEVVSIYSDGSSNTKISFNYEPLEETSIVNKSIEDTSSIETYSKITLSDCQSNTRYRMAKISFMRDLALHFFSYFVAGRLPQIEVSFNGTNEELKGFIQSKVHDPDTQTISIYDADEELEHHLQVTHVYADKTLSTGLKNRLLFTAHGRAVGDPIEIERKFALNELSNGRCYVGVVSGEILDTTVDQERTDFKLPKKLLEKIRDEVLKSTEEYLSDHIAKRRRTQANVVSNLLIEHPQLSIRVESVDNYLETLSPGMDEEQIGESLFTHLYREERKVSQQIVELKSSDHLKDGFEKQLDELTEKVSTQHKNRLAELVVKRRQILDLLGSYRKYSDKGEETNHYEAAVHDLICPMRNFYSSGNYADHNLWILDDLLAFYQFFASDKSIKSITTNSDSTKEPDVLFVNPLGFQRDGTNDPVAIIEFKRPGDDDISGNPVDQVLGYIEKLRDKTVKDPNGEVLSHITEKTRFQCYVILELTEKTRKLIRRSPAPYEMPDGEGYFGFAPEHQASIHIISYRKLLADAEKRNEVFFKKLGLLSIPKVSKTAAV